MRFLYLFLVTPIIICTSIAYSKGQNFSPECIVAVQSTKFVANFSIINPKQNTWIWNTKPAEINEIDYSWVVEPGVFVNNKFQPSTYAFGLGHRNEFPQKQNNTGSLKDLLREISSNGSVYMNTTDKQQRANADIKIGYIKIGSAFHNQNVLLFSREEYVVKLIFGSYPTHAKLTFHTPYPLQSYTCITQINYL